MAFEDNVNYKMITDRMKNTVKNRSVFHAYIIEGQNQAEKLSLANNFIKAILCEASSGDACEHCISCRKINHGNHEDVIYIAPDGNSIKDEVVWELQSRLKKKPYSGERNIAVVSGADSLTPKAQNRLLKTLEEPLGKNIIILLTQNAGNLTQTINSRCILFRLPLPEGRLMTEAVNEHYNLIAFAKGLMNQRPLYLLSGSLKEIGLKRENAMDVLETLESWYRDMLILSFEASKSSIANSEYRSELISESRLCHPKDLVSIIQAIEVAKDDINKNINVSYALKSMLLKIQEEKDGKGSRNQI